jgi:hypothetical protein
MHMLASPQERFPADSRAVRSPPCCRLMAPCSLASTGMLTRCRSVHPCLHQSL